MKHLSLFSGGCDGFSLAAEWMGWTNIAHIEIDEWNQKLLRQNFPESKVYGDIREFNRSEAAKYRGRIDIITGGFPCQPFSSAGKRKGTEDDRYLWPAMLETIRTIQPAFVVGENVAGLTSMEDGETFEGICTSLEDEGYTVESFVLPAASVGAWHRRDRIWIICYTNGSARRKEAKARVEMEQDPLDRSEWKEDTNRAHPPSQFPTYSDSQGSPIAICGPKRSIPKKDGAPQGRKHSRAFAASGDYWKAEPRVGRVVDGLPNRTHRIKALGNAVVPQIPYEIFKAIEVLTHSA